MAEFKPREFYYHSCEARQSTEERLTMPLHYYLKRGDLIAFRRTLRTGAASPLLTDQYGKTILDLCLDELDDIFITGFCTSFPIDDLISSVISGGSKLTTSKFHIEDENELWAGVYEQHEKALYKTFSEGSPNLVRPVTEADRQRYIPQQHKGYPVSHVDVGRVRAEAMIKDPEDRKHPHFGKQSSKASNDGTSELSKDDATSTSGREGGSDAASDIQSSPEHSVLIAVSDTLSRPLSARVRIKLQKLIRRLRVYLALCEELCSCEDLVAITMNRRQKLCELMDEPATTLVLTNFRVPFLYICTMRLLLELYPSAPDGVFWKATSPIDLRVLAGLVCRLELPGHFILLFLAEYATCLAKYLLTLPPYAPTDNSEHFKTGKSVTSKSSSTSQLDEQQSDITQRSTTKKFIFNLKTDAHQYLLHLAFVLDCPELFDILSASLIANKLKESGRGTKVVETSGGIDEPAGSLSNNNIQHYIDLLTKLLL